MLSRLTKKLRIKAAIALAVLYALCVLAPSAALAFLAGPTAIHCLTDQHGFAGSHDHGGTVHVHGDGAVHRHHDSGTHEQSDSDSKMHPGQCCGLFCMTAAAADGAVSLVGPTHFTFAGPLLDDRLAGRGPDRVNRPPIA